MKKLRSENKVDDRTAMIDDAIDGMMPGTVDKNGDRKTSQDCKSTASNANLHLIRVLISVVD